MSSRVIVKNLPPYYTSEHLRSHFAEKGEVTDAKVLMSPTGKSRQFGFIGFRSDHEAEQAVRHFHRSFVDSFRLGVEFARPIGDPTIARPWSKYSKAKSSALNAGEESDPNNSYNVNDKNIKNKDDEFEAKKKKHLAAIGIVDTDEAGLKDFMAVMEKKKSWENDDVIDLPSLRNDQDPEADELYDDFPSANQLNKKKISEECREPTVDDFEDYNSDDDLNEDLKQIPTADANLKNEPEQNEKLNVDEGAVKILEDTGRLFIRNLGFSTTEEDLRQLFERFGPISGVSYSPLSTLPVSH
jgi:multiple RNA-binding domain-containing protein 1